MRHLLLTASFLCVAHVAFASGNLFATTTSYEVFGGTAQIEMDAPHAATLDAYQIHSDAVVRDFGERWVFIVNRLYADNILVLDAQSGFGVVTQYSVASTGLNPRDIHVERAPGGGPGRAFITLYESNSLLVCDALTGANPATVDLSAFADADGLCEMDQMASVPPREGHPEGLLLVSLQRQDRSGAWWVAGDAKLALVDIATEALVDADALAPGVQGIDLLLRNPFWRMELSPFAGSNGRILVGCPGDYAVDDGGVEIVNPYTLQSEGLLVSDAQLGGDVLDFALVSETVGWAIRSNSSFQTALVQFDPSTGLVTQTAHSSAGFDLVDLELDRNGRLFVGDRDATDPGVRIYDATTGSLLAGPLDTGLPPFDLTLVEDVPTGAPPQLSAHRLRASPNPFNPRVEIRLEQAPKTTRLEILDLKGRRVARLNGMPDGDAVRWIWDGTTASGSAAASGVYLARAVGTPVAPVKLSLVR